MSKRFQSGYKVGILFDKRERYPKAIEDIMTDLQILRTIPLFYNLTYDDLQEVLELFVLKKFHRKNLLILENEPEINLYVIKKGCVKLSWINEDGNEVILSVLYSGDFFGEFSLIEGMTWSVNVIALDDLDAFMLQRRDFLYLMSKYPAISINLHRELAFRTNKLYSKIKRFSIMNAEGRVASMLMGLAEDIGILQKGDVHLVNLFRQRDLANIAGTSRETISRFLSKFERRGLVKKCKNELIIFNYDRFKDAFN